MNSLQKIACLIYGKELIEKNRICIHFFKKNLRFIMENYSKDNLMEGQLEAYKAFIQLLEDSQNRVKELSELLEGLE